MLSPYVSCVGSGPPKKVNTPSGSHRSADTQDQTARPCPALRADGSQLRGSAAETLCHQRGDKPITRAALGQVLITQSPPGAKEPMMLKVGF